MKIMEIFDYDGQYFVKSGNWWLASGKDFFRAKWTDNIKEAFGFNIRNTAERAISFFNRNPVKVG